MFTSKTPGEISRLYEGIELLEQHFSGAHSVRRVSRQGELALYIADRRGKELLYVGVLYDLWLKAHVPLWYGVKNTWDSRLIQCFCRHNQGRCITYEDFIVCPLGQQPGGPPDTGAILSIVDEQLSLLQEEP